MSENTNNIDIDAAKVSDLVEEYRETTDREEQREIENQVLAETVWKAAPHEDEGLLLNEAQVEKIYEKLPEDAAESRRILRSYYVEKL